MKPALAFHHEMQDTIPTYYSVVHVSGKIPSGIIVRGEGGAVMKESLLLNESFIPRVGTHVHLIHVTTLYHNSGMSA